MNEMAQPFKLERFHNDHMQLVWSIELFDILAFTFDCMEKMKFSIVEPIASHLFGKEYLACGSITRVLWLFQIICDHRKSIYML